MYMHVMPLYNVHTLEDQKEVGRGDNSPVLEELAVAVEAFGGVCDREKH